MQTFDSGNTLTVKSTNGHDTLIHSDALFQVKIDDGDNIVFDGDFQEVADHRLICCCCCSNCCMVSRSPLAYTVELLEQSLLRRRLDRSRWRADL